MSNERILALSSSRVGSSDYLEMATPMLKQMLGETSVKIAVIPFAFVGEDKSALVEMVRSAFAGLPYIIDEVKIDGDRSVIEKADAIMVSGGNTFKLLHDLYRSGLLTVIQEKVKNGTPYIGWSAGSNITGATICTTNDMPIIEPESFKALAFFPFQINPHYYNVPIEGFNGETRDDRLTEYVKLNPKMPVLCLPEGTAVSLETGVLKLIGIVPGVLMRNADGRLEKAEIHVNEDISHLLKH
jgi:dipeptidase E